MIMNQKCQNCQKCQKCQKCKKCSSKNWLFPSFLIWRHSWRSIFLVWKTFTFSSSDMIIHNADTVDQEGRKITVSNVNLLMCDTFLSGTNWYGRNEFVLS